jgi:hypothetical protein
MLCCLQQYCAAKSSKPRLQSVKQCEQRLWTLLGRSEPEQCAARAESQYPLWECTLFSLCISFLVISWRCQSARPLWRAAAVFVVSCQHNRRTAARSACRTNATAATASVYNYLRHFLTALTAVLLPTAVLFIGHERSDQLEQLARLFN